MRLLYLSLNTLQGLLGFLFSQFLYMAHMLDMIMDGWIFFIQCFS